MQYEQGNLFCKIISNITFSIIMMFNKKHYYIKRKHSYYHTVMSIMAFLIKPIYAWTNLIL